MENFILALGVIMPLTVYMLVGALIRASGIFSRENFKSLNQMLFRVLIPLSLFFSISGSDLREVMDLPLTLMVEILLIVSAVTAWFLLGRFIKDKRDLATIVQGIFRSNLVLFGGVIAAALCDEGGAALVAAVTAIVVPTINIMGVVLFELARGGKIDIRSLLWRIAKNPLVIAGVLGVFFSLTHLRLPAVVETPLKNLGAAATPVSLVSLGGILSFESIKKHRAYLGIATLGKLIILPLAGVLIAIAMGRRGNAMVAVLVAFASPTAVASAPMAQAMGGNGDLAGEIVAATSIGCLFTLFALVSALSAAGFL